MAFSFPPPQGYPATAPVATVQVAIATGTASTTETFVLVGGTSSSAYNLAVPTPSSAATILNVSAWYGAGGNYQVYASASGYADGSSAAALAYTADFLAGSSSAYVSWEAGGALSLAAGSIVLPAPYYGSYTVTVTYLA